MYTIYNLTYMNLYKYMANQADNSEEARARIFFLLL